MADPWKEDFVALDERARKDLHPMAATRALRHQEAKPMRFSFKQRPLFSALVVLAVLLAAPLAYAVVNRVLLRVDPDKSAPEIESDLKSQLEQAGMPNADVHVDKSGDGDRTQLKVKIRAQGSDELESDISIDPGGHPGTELERHAVAVRIAAQLSAAQQQQVTEVVSSEAFSSLLETGQPDLAAIKKVLADHGIDATVEDDGGATRVTITAVH